MADIAPAGLSKTFLCPGGGEAVEAALKLAIRVTGRTEVLSLHGAYHGMSLATMGLSGIPALREWFPGGVRWPNFHQVPSGNCVPTADSACNEARGRERSRPGARGDARRRHLRPRRRAHHRTGAEAQEDTSSTGPTTTERFSASAASADILLIVDEVQTGLARCGAMWACDLFDVQPDIVVVGKAFGGGFPFGAIVARGELVDDQLESEPWHILTFMNQPLQAAAGLAVIDVVEQEDLVARARTLGQRAMSRFEALADKYEVVGDIRGPGLFIGIDLVEDSDTKKPATTACREAWAWALDRGLITWFGGAGNVLKFKPPLTTPEDDFDEMLDLVEQTVEFVEQRVHATRGVLA